MPLRQMTVAGCGMVRARIGGTYYKYGAYYHAHFLGKVEITEVYDIHPCEMSGEELEAWARADGFHNFAVARCWFEIRYGACWMHQYWTVVCWHGWVERYFEPMED